ncbi:MAG: catechol 1,2-dioxygenase [Pseudonocardia sp.]|nr:catechol 1,2-dioxygenase [Pseudonocardia sp.]
MNDPNPARATKIAGDIVDSLKDVIRRRQVTIDEFRETIDYVGSVVRGDSNVEGPFFVADAPLLDPGGVLPMRPGEPGEQLLFSGSVRSTDGCPLASAMVDIWQADDAGLYSQFAPDIPQWNLRGRIRTDADGRFAFRTVVPAAYDIPGLPHTARLLGILGMEPHRPAHVHVKIAADDHRDLTTQVYFAGDPWLERDVVGAAKPSLVTQLQDSADTATDRECAFDFVLTPTRRGAAEAV